MIGLNDIEKGKERGTKKEELKKKKERKQKIRHPLPAGKNPRQVKSKSSQKVGQARRGKASSQSASSTDAMSSYPQLSKSHADIQLLAALLFSFFYATTAQCRSISKRYRFQFSALLPSAVLTSKPRHGSPHVPRPSPGESVGAPHSP